MRDKGLLKQRSKGIKVLNDLVKLRHSTKNHLSNLSLKEILAFFAEKKMTADTNRSVNTSGGPLWLRPQFR